MKIEHVAFTVQDPVATAAWYVANLGMTIVRTVGPPTYTHFLADEGGATVLEIYNNPKVACPDYPSWDPLLLHVAFACDDVPAGRDRLRAAGATLQDDVVTLPTGDTLAMLRDPWGVPIQLVCRAEPMV